MSKDKLEVLGRGTCKTCKFFDRKVEDKADGLCRESSPQVSLLMIRQENHIQRTAEMVPQIVANFPQVGDDCWCGKWQGKWASLQN